MSARRKNFVVSELAPTTEQKCTNAESTLPLLHGSTIVRFPPSPLPSRKFDFGPFYGTGADEVTSAIQHQVCRFLEGKDRQLEIPSIITICRLGARSFLSFLRTEAVWRGRSVVLTDIDRSMINRYLAYIRIEKASLSGRRRTYSTVKSVILSLSARGLVEGRALFPDNPFPRTRGQGHSAKGYSPMERQSIARALREAIAPLFQVGCGEPSRRMLVYCLLSVALRTGRNLSPLLDLDVDCLRPHFKEGMKLLVVTKRRSAIESSIAVRGRETADSIVGVMPSTVRLIQRVTELSEAYRNEAPEAIRNKLWLFRYRGKVRCLNPSHLTVPARELSARFHLVNDEGALLRVNTARMRKTFANRVFEITEGDLHATASAAGHTPSVADDHYLAPDRQSERNWRFMGEMLASELNDGKVGSGSEPTPVGRCRDNTYGEYAPKSGAHCTNFLRCMRCRSYVVTAEDLHKLFSFYWLLVSERKQVSSRQWSRHYGSIVRAIDRDIAERGVTLKLFSQSEVDSARKQALDHPHPYWSERGSLLMETLG